MKSVIVRTNLFELILEITLFFSGTFFRESRNLYPRRGRGSLVAKRNLLRLIVALGLVLLDVLDLLDGLAVVDAVGAVVRLHGRGEGGGRGEAEDKGEGLHVGRHFESGRVSSLTPPPGLL